MRNNRILPLKMLYHHPMPIDSLFHCSKDAAEELKQVIGDLSKLRSELMTDKPLTPLKLSNKAADGDAIVWNDYLKARQDIEGPALTWYSTVWLLSECYMYRRINQALVLT